MYNSSHLFLECVPSNFQGKNGETVTGYMNYILERTEHNGRVYYKTLTKWTRDKTEITFGMPVDCVFTSDGKVANFMLHTS